MPKVEIKLNLSAIDGIRKAAADAAWETLEGVRTQVKNAQLMPKRSGELEKSMAPPVQKTEDDSIVTRLTSGGGDTPYARRLYEHPEFDFYQGENKNAQGEWLQPWLPSGDLEGYIPDKFSERLRAKLQE